MTQRILLIDDDKELCQLLEEFLCLEGFSVSAVHDGVQAIERCREDKPDAMVLDIMLPSMQGLEVLRRIREFSTVPILMLTARGEDTDRIIGLEMGADDYLPKPCNPRELAARLRAILRRRENTAGSGATELQIGQLSLSPARRQATLSGEPLTLTSAEFSLLQCLMENAGQAVDKETLCQHALGRPLSAYDRSVDVHISKLRRKLADVDEAPLIVSVRGVGYQFTGEA